MAFVCVAVAPNLTRIFCAAPVLVALRKRYPQHRLVVECERVRHHDLLRCYPEVDEVVTDSDLLTETPDHYLIAHPAWYRPGPGETPPPLTVQCLEAAVAQVGPLGETPSGPYAPLPEDALAALAGDPRLPSAYAVIHTGAGMFSKTGQGRVWPETAAAALVNVLEGLGLPVMQVGLPQEAAIPGAIDLRGAKLDLILALISRARLFVGVDSGPAYAADAFGTPMVWLGSCSAPDPVTALGPHRPGACRLVADTASDISATTVAEAGRQLLAETAQGR